MTRVGHHATGSKRRKRIHDAPIIGCDDYLLYKPALAHTIHDMLHERPAGFAGENLGWKARRTKAGGNNDRRSQSRASREPPANFKLQSKNSEDRAGCQTTIVSIVNPPASGFRVSGFRKYRRDADFLLC
jgi:hypothetical protein